LKHYATLNKHSALRTNCTAVASWNTSLLGPRHLSPRWRSHKYTSAPSNGTTPVEKIVTRTTTTMALTVYTAIVVCLVSAVSLHAKADETSFSSHCPQAIDLPSSPTNTSFSALHSLFQSASGPQDPTAIEAIKNTLALYPFAIDSKDFSALSEVFTPDAVANYSAPLNVLTPLSTIESVLEASLAPVATQHSYGTQFVQLCGPCAARTVTYFRAAHFGVGAYEGEALYAYGQYRDVLVLGEQGWRIKERTLAYMVRIPPPRGLLAVRRLTIVPAGSTHR